MFGFVLVKRIKYKVSFEPWGEDISITPCPYRLRDEEGDFINVGDYGCIHCSHYHSQQYPNHSVLCDKWMMPLKEIPSYCAEKLNKVLKHGSELPTPKGSGHRI